MKQFPDVNSKYGAPMGRPTYGDPGDRPMQLFRVKLVDGDYDDGGAYWGGPPSDPLWCLRGDDVQYFVRAKSRWQAFEGFREDFPNLRLKVPV